jgi:Flp pilus assembly protein CpaB
MRASTIFALIVAVLLGLGAAVGIKYSGVLERKTEATKTKSMPPVLVAANNIFEGALLQASDVKIRAARPEELSAYSAHDLLPAVTQAAVRRVAKVAIEADRPIRKDMLEDLSSPGSITDRIGPCDRGVHCCLNKIYCAGGLLQPGDYVDVYLTTTLEGQNGSQLGSRTAQALLARGVRIAARRNSLLPKDTPLGPDCCINYDLSANPYRAALIEYALNVGILSLHPVGTVEKNRLETEWKRKREEAEALRVRGDTAIATASTGDRNEPYLAPYCRTGDELEDKRIAGILNGSYTVSDKDLMEIFGFKYTPPVPRPSIETVSGVKVVGIREFGTDSHAVVNAPVGSIDIGKGIRTTGYETPSSGIMRFRAPDGLCPTGTTTTTAAPVVRRRN